MPKTGTAIASGSSTCALLLGLVDGDPGHVAELHTGPEPAPEAVHLGPRAWGRSPAAQGVVSD
jgi:hypothetical protein